MLLLSIAIRYELYFTAWTNILFELFCAVRCFSPLVHIMKNISFFSSVVSVLLPFHSRFNLGTASSCSFSPTRPRHPSLSARFLVLSLAGIKTRGQWGGTSPSHPKARPESRATKQHFQKAIQRYQTRPLCLPYRGRVMTRVHAEESGLGGVCAGSVATLSLWVTCFHGRRSLTSLSGKKVCLVYTQTHVIRSLQHNFRSWKAEGDLEMSERLRWILATPLRFLSLHFSVRFRAGGG